MKKSNWLLLALSAVSAVLLRVWQNRTGFEESGLAIRGNLPGILLPVVLAAAAAYFIVSLRALPKRCEEPLSARFRFRGNLAAVFCAVAGAFLVMSGAALSIVSRSGRVEVLLALFAIAAAVCVLGTVFALSRGGEASGLALLVPVCALLVYLIYGYRANASEPVLARIYIAILAGCALTLSSLKRVAFAYRDGTPRSFAVTGAMAVILALAAAADGTGLSAAMLFAGCAAIELGFLAAADLSAAGMGGNG